MSDTTTTTKHIDWPGESGQVYRYWIHPLPPNFKAAPGNYIFAREARPGVFVPVYMGQTDDLSERFDDHHKAGCIEVHGATHIHAHLNDDEQARLDEEADLIAKWNPPCNG